MSVEELNTDLQLNTSFPVRLLDSEPDIFNGSKDSVPKLTEMAVGDPAMAGRLC